MRPSRAPSTTKSLIRADGVVQDEAAGAADADGVADAGFVDGFAHGGAAEDDGFEAEEGGVGGEVDVEFAIEGAMVEQDAVLG